MNYDRWIETFKPVKNDINPTSLFDGNLFETYGDEIYFVCRAGRKNIWTLIDDEQGFSILPGYRQVNRLGYFVTEVEFTRAHESGLCIDLDR